MSGLVITSRSSRSILARSASLVSPSYTPALGTNTGTRASSPRAAAAAADAAAARSITRNARSWSCASALVGNRYNAVAAASDVNACNTGAL